MFTFAASRTSGEVQHNFGDTSLHSRFGSQHFGRFPAICGLKNVVLPETAESLKIWRGYEEYKTGFASTSFASTSAQNLMGANLSHRLRQP